MEAGRFDDWETKIGTQVATAAAPQRQELTGRKRRRKTHLTLTGLLMEVAHYPPTVGNLMRHIVTDLAVNARVALPRRFSELAVFDARLYIRVRRVDQPA
jgi:hypothetical protein